MWNELRNVSNVQFYAANGEDLSWLESESFDIINYAYVLHEMPATSAMAMVSEMYRLLRPGGVMNGFEVPFPDSDWERQYMVDSNTWGYDWQVEIIEFIFMTFFTFLTFITFLIAGL